MITVEHRTVTGESGMSKRYEPCPYCDWRDLLTAKQTIILAIQGGNITVIEIATKLSELGVHFKPAENEIRARLSELRKDGLVYEEWKGGQVWQLSAAGTLKAADITPQLRDDELELFAGLSATEAKP